MVIIAKYLPQLNSNCFRAINKVCTSLGLKPRKNFKLLEKTSGTDVLEFANNQYCFSPKDAAKYTYVNIGKKSNSLYKNEILTFFDNQGRILRRYFRQDGINTELHNYKYDGNVRTVEKSFFSTSHINSLILTPNWLNFAGRWEKQSTEHQLIYRFVRDLVKKGKQASLVLSRKIQYTPNNSDIERITFTRYPINLGFESKTKKQVVNGTLTYNSQDVKLSEITHSGNVDIDLRDEFLRFRFIDPRSDKGLTLLTKKFLKDKNLDKMGILVCPSSHKVSSNSLGYFSEWDQEICFSSKIKKGTPVSAVQAVAHEVEHAYQHSLIGRIGRSRTKYGSNAMKQFGAPTENERKCAVIYAIARDNYPVVNSAEDLSQNLRYKNNLLEVDARLAEQDAGERYRKYRSNFEFFEQFYE